MKIKSIVLSTISCAAIGVIIAAAIVLVNNRNIGHSNDTLATYGNPEDATLEGRIGLADFVGEVRILGINRRYLAEDFDSKTNQIIVAPGSEGKFVDPNQPAGNNSAAYDPLTEYDAEIVSVIGGNLTPGQRIVIRSYGHGSTTPEEEKANTRAGRKTEKKGDTFIYILLQVKDGRYVGADGHLGRMKLAGNKLKYDYDDGDVLDKNNNKIDKNQLELITHEKIGKRKQGQGQKPPLETTTIPPSSDPQSQPASGP